MIWRQKVGILSYNVSKLAPIPRKTRTKIQKRIASPCFISPLSICTFSYKKYIYWTCDKNMYICILCAYGFFIFFCEMMYTYIIFYIFLFWIQFCMLIGIISSIYRSYIIYWEGKSEAIRKLICCVLHPEIVTIF